MTSPRIPGSSPKRCLLHLRSSLSGWPHYAPRSPPNRARHCACCGCYPSPHGSRSTSWNSRFRRPGSRISAGATSVTSRSCCSVCRLSRCSCGARAGFSRYGRVRPAFLPVPLPPLSPARSCNSDACTSRSTYSFTTSRRLRSLPYWAHSVGLICSGSESKHGGDAVRRCIDLPYRPATAGIGVLRSARD